MPPELLATCWTHAGDAMPVAGRHLSPLDLRARAEAVAGAGFTGIGFTIDDLDAARATYWGGQARQITLKDGEFRGPKGQHVQLLRQFYRTGDLEGDGAVDTVVVLSVTDAGDESGQYIAVLRHLEMETISLGAERLGQVEVRDMRVEGKRIVVDLLRHAAPGAAPEPSQVAYELGRGELVRVEAAQTR